MTATKKLRAAVAKVVALAEVNPEAAAVVREKIRPDIQFVGEEVERRGAMAALCAEGVSVEDGIEPLCLAAEELPAQLERIGRKYERAVGIRPPRRKALWKK